MTTEADVMRVAEELLGNLSGTGSGDYIGQLARNLLTWHSGNAFAGTTNERYMDVTLTASALEAAMRSPQGYSTSAGLNAWAGYHKGTWYWNGGQTPDNAKWDSATELCGGGQRQTVNWYSDHFQSTDRPAGYNRASPHFSYLWGYDPKPNARIYHEHLGLTFSPSGSSSVKGIIWITRGGSFLELINTSNGKKCSAGNGGQGQWTVYQSLPPE